MYPHLIDRSIDPCIDIPLVKIPHKTRPRRSSSRNWRVSGQHVYGDTKRTIVGRVTHQDRCFLEQDGSRMLLIAQRGGGEKGVIDLKQSTWVEGRTRNCKICGFLWGAKRTTNTTTTTNTSDYYYYYYYYYYYVADQRSIRVAGLDFLHVKVDKSRGFLNHCFVVSWGSRSLARSSPFVVVGFLFKNLKNHGFF